MNAQIEYDDQIKIQLTHIASIQRELMLKVPAVLLIILVHRILLMIDPYQDFNPTHTLVFDVLLAVTVFVSVTYLLYDHTIKENDLEKAVPYRIYKVFHTTLDYMVIIPYLVFSITVLNMFVFSFSPISGSSMAPSFSDDEAVIFSHLSNEYERGDVVILYEDTLDDPYLIKRIIGLPGETVTIKEGRVYINDTLLEEPYIDETEVVTSCLQPQQNECRFTVEENTYFVLGDNRNGHALQSLTGYSIDSRTFGVVDEANIYGKVIFQFKDYNLLNR
ncbi:MAG: signal peptidase I [Candidatus Izemoplasma sp.]|nr:signal peptidase I [Candidatus Izemoplasma sp.]